MTRKTQIIGTLAVVAIGAAIMMFGGKTPEVAEEVVKLETVLVQPVANLVGTTTPLVVYGTVVASDSVDVVPEISGVVSRVNKRLGDAVQAGDVIVELQNTAQRQTVLQAQAAVSVADAQLTQVKNGSDAEDISNQETDVVSKKTALDQTVITSKQTANNLFITTVTSLESSFDQYFDDPKRTPQLLFVTSDIADTNALEAARVNLALLALETEQKILSATNTPAGAKSAFDAVAKFTASYTKAIDLMSSITQNQPNSKTPQADKDLRFAQLRTMKQVVVSVESQLASARVTLDGASAAYTVAQTNLSRLQDGADAEDISIAQSGLSSARSQLAAAQLGLEKTYIKAPTSGKLSAMNVTPGQLVGQTPVFTVASSGIKRVDVFVASQDVERITMGSTALVDGRVTGTVTRISPSIDPLTGKIKVEILITNDSALVVEGAGVGVSIQITDQSNGFSIPIEAVFVEEEVSYVYVVTPTNILEKRAIETDGLYGSSVIVRSGLEAADSLVLLARGLKEGQTVTPETK